MCVRALGETRGATLGFGRKDVCAYPALSPLGSVVQPSPFGCDIACIYINAIAIPLVRIAPFQNPYTERRSASGHTGRCALKQMVWVSHKHGDHILGVPSLLSLRSSSSPPLLLLGPSSLHAWLADSFPALHAKFTFAQASLFKAPTPQRFGRGGGGVGGGRGGGAGVQPRAAPCGCVGLDMFQLPQSEGAALPLT